MPWILGWFALGGNPNSVIKNLTNAEQQIIQVPVNTAIKAWALVVGIGAVAGIAIWLTESEISKKQGFGAVAPPPVEPLHVATAPTFGASSGVSAAGGPVRLSGGITSGGGAEGPGYAEPRRGAAHESMNQALLAGGGRGTKSERQARETSARASIAENKVREARANATAAKGFSRRRVA